MFAGAADKSRVGMFAGAADKARAQFMIIHHSGAENAMNAPPNSARCHGDMVIACWGRDWR